MSLTRRDEDLLAWFFEEGAGLFRRSPFALEASYLPAEDDVLRAAKVSRRLRLMAASDRAAEQTLETYYGALGAWWARTSLGRVFALYPLTEAGAMVVREEQSSRPDEDLLPHERIARLWRMQRRDPAPARRELCALVHAQAERRLHAAWRAWRATDAPRVKVRTP